MAPLRLWLFGPPRLERAGRPLEITLRRAQALLTYLVVTGRPHGRDTLAALLWPDGDDREVKARLRRTVYRLVAAIGNDVLLTEGDTIRLSPSAGIWVDCLAFETDAASGLTLGDSDGRTEPEQIQHLTRAAALYTDDFLAGFSVPDSPAWDDWQFLQRERLRQMCTRLLDRLIEAHEARGEWDAAIEHARRRLAFDTLHEPAHRALMQVYTEAGIRSAALRQYQECVRILEAELGVPPDEETTALYEVIRARHTVVAAAESPVAAASQVRSESHHPTAIPVRRGPSAHRSLPLLSTSFVGREREQELIGERLLHEGTRLLTLTGTGGAGKTRLAVSVAASLEDRFADGVVWVALAPIASHELVASTVAQALGVHDDGQRGLAESLADALSDKELLLVLDNCEHVLMAAPLVAHLLTACPRLTVLATSRAPLHVRDEHVWLVPPLALPSQDHVLPISALSRYASVALFVDRAQSVVPGFTLTTDNAGAVAEICRRLDGLPLAIELAAARVKLLTPAALVARLQPRLRLLTGGARDLPSRQQTLRDTIAWSYNLLDAAEQTLFRSMAPFAGGWTLDAAEQVSSEAPGNALDGLSSLVDKNLVFRMGSAADEPRFGMLETVGEYAQERLAASGDEDAVRRRHAEYFASLAEAAASSVMTAEEGAWHRRLKAEHDNVRAALDWTLSAGRDPLMGLRLVSHLTLLWAKSEHHVEGLRWLQVALSANGEPSRERAIALMGAGHLQRRSGNHLQAAAFLDEAAQVGRVIDERKILSQALGHLAFALVDAGEIERAQAPAEESLALAHELDEPLAVGQALHNAGTVAHQGGQYDRAEALHRKSLAMFRATGNQYGAAWSLLHLGMLVLLRGDDDEAESLLQDSLELHRTSGDALGVAWVLVRLGLIALRAGDEERALTGLREGLISFRDLGVPRGVASGLTGIAELAMIWGDREMAAQLLGAAQALRARIGDRWFPVMLRVEERLRYQLFSGGSTESICRAEQQGAKLSCEEAIDLALRVERPERQ